MTSGIALIFRKPSYRPGSWKRDDVYDAVFTLRMVIAIIVGLVCGLGKLEGLMVFLGFLGVNFMGPTSWLNYQNINTEEFDSEQAPLHMEGFPQSVSLFVLIWIAAYSIAG